MADSAQKVNGPATVDSGHWNFTKFVVNRQGNVVARFEPTADREELGNYLYLDSGTMTPLLKTTEKRGWVTRCCSAGEERVLNDPLTERASIGNKKPCSRRSSGRSLIFEVSVQRKLSG